jgi:hypothetical protein
MARAEYLVLGTRDGGQLDGATEALVLVGVIVLQSNLELDGLGELALLGVRGLLDLVDRLGDGLGGEFAERWQEQGNGEPGEKTKTRLENV